VSFEHVKEIAKTVGGKIESAIVLPDGSGAATVSYPLPKTHWIYGDRTVENLVCEPDCYHEPPPMPLRFGTEEQFSAAILFHVNDWPERMTREMFAEQVRRVARYAIRASTMNGAEEDFDPDAMVQNFVTGMLGYHTDDGLSHMEQWSNPPSPGFVTRK
jgi:hypothetical protein